MWARTAFVSELQCRGQIVDGLLGPTQQNHDLATRAGEEALIPAGESGHADAAIEIYQKCYCSYRLEGPTEARPR
jgi:hypothetical protein